MAAKPTNLKDTTSVKDYQQMLNESGAKLAVDGKWGAKTEAAYQKYTADQEKAQKQAQLQSLLDSAMNAGSGIGASYDAAAESYKNSQNAAYESTRANLNNQKNQLNDQYEGIRSQAYVNARLKAVGNNEALASKGLAGNMYDSAQSGISETSRIAQDVNMRNDINSATREEQSAVNEIAQAIIQAGYTRDQNIAMKLAELSIGKSSAQAAASQNSIGNILSLMSYQDSLKEPAKTPGKKKPSGLTPDEFAKLQAEQAAANAKSIADSTAKEKALQVSSINSNNKKPVMINRGVL